MRQDVFDLSKKLPNTGKIKKKFHWRLRVDVRHAVDIPVNYETQSGQPGALIELGWTVYDKMSPEEGNL